MASNRGDEALALPELHERILSFLPMKDLLLAQRVSRGWHTAIKSPRLQEQLFMRPKKPAPLRWVCEATDDYSHLPGGRRKYGYMRVQRVAPDYQAPKALPEGSRGIVPLKLCEINPMLFGFHLNPRAPGIFDELKQIFYSSDEIDPEGGYPHRGPAMTLVDCFEDPAMAFCDASWRKMLVTQPPIDSCQVEYKYDGRLNKTFSVEDSGGENFLTCADMVDSMSDAEHNTAPRAGKKVLFCIDNTDMLYRHDGDLAEFQASEARFWAGWQAEHEAKERAEAEKILRGSEPIYEYRGFRGD